MKKLSKEFLGNEVLFMGYSSRNPAYSKSIYKAFTDKGVKVYPFNTRKDASFDIKVYSDLDSLPKAPECAYILLDKENTRKAVNMLKNRGVKKILFHNQSLVDSDTLNECEKAGIETYAGCPMMLLGGGLHRFHGFLSGVKR